MPRERSLVLFIATSLLLAAPGLLAVAMSGKLALHTAINAHHTPVLDHFFRVVTHLGDGLVPTALALLFLIFRDLRSFLMMGLSCGLSALVVQFLKRVVFDGMDRPGKFREALGSMHWVDGIDLNYHNSFPSGHSTAAFAMCLALAVIFARPRLAVLLALLAGVLAFSRVYLSQHFTEDILAGSALGTLGGVVVHWWLYRSKFARKNWLDGRPGQFRKG
jgi:membrane-associated phospholipid phosphatase